MIYTRSPLAIVIFLAFVGITLGLSFFLGRKAKSSAGYFAAHGQIHWFINGIAFAGDYLSAASFLGICGMIAFFGYDGFLYSIGYLAGWIVALFVVAEPMKRLGKFTFADALDARFQSPAIKLVAGISTLVVSVFYLIPQMVGAGALVQPLLGLPHAVGVILVGITVMVIVVTAGMVSTTWVQFLKGSLLVVFCSLLTWMILARGFTVRAGGIDGHAFRSWGPWPVAELTAASELPSDPQWQIVPPSDGWEKEPVVRLRHRQTQEVVVTWMVDVPTSPAGGSAAGGSAAPQSASEGGVERQVRLEEAQTKTVTAGGQVLVNGRPLGRNTAAGEAELHPVGHLTALPGGATATGPLGPLEFFRTLQQSEVVLWRSKVISHPTGDKTTLYYPQRTSGQRVLRPGESPVFKGIRTGQLTHQLDFLSLMLALFCGTASLPHILIRYYTVKDESSARKSTIVGITSIGFFYILTLYLGLGAMVSGALDVTDNNMSAPLLARSMNSFLFAVISAIAFTTVLGTVSGLILASAGAVTHDLLTSFWGMKLTDHEQVRVAKFASLGVGAVAIVLGILFEKLNVSFLVGWAFSVAASANLPSLVMLLFWRGVTKAGVVAAVTVGMVSSLAWILASGETFAKVYGITDHPGWTPFSQPGLVTIPLGFLTLIFVSLATARPASR